jgi:hypothetical protein
MPGDDAIIPLSAAARLWRISRATVYEWHAAGRVSFFRNGRRGLEASVRDVRRAKVLSDPALQAFLQQRVPPELVNLAIQNGIVVPEEGRFSLDDVETLKQFATVGHIDLPPSSPRRISGMQVTAFRWSVEDERAWVQAGADPVALPDRYWATPIPPRFIPPVDVFLYSFGKRVGGNQLVHRSAGYEQRGAELVWRLETNDYTREGRRRLREERLPRTVLAPDRLEAPLTSLGRGQLLVDRLRESIHPDRELLEPAARDRATPKRVDDLLSLQFRQVGSGHESP